MQVISTPSLSTGLPENRESQLGTLLIATPTSGRVQLDTFVQSSFVPRRGSVGVEPVVIDFPGRIRARSNASTHRVWEPGPKDFQASIDLKAFC